MTFYFFSSNFSRECPAKILLYYFSDSIKNFNSTHHCLEISLFKFLNKEVQILKITIFCRMCYQQLILYLNNDLFCYFFSQLMEPQSKHFHLQKYSALEYLLEDLLFFNIFFSLVFPFRKIYFKLIVFFILFF